MTPQQRKHKLMRNHTISGQLKIIACDHVGNTTYTYAVYLQSKIKNKKGEEEEIEKNEKRSRQRRRRRRKKKNKIKKGGRAEEEG